LTWGTFDNQLTTDARDMYFSSRSIKLDLNFDVLKLGTFTTFIGTGITGNLSSGLVGTGGSNQARSSYFFKEKHFAFNYALGFRIYSQNNRLAYELRLLELAIEPTYEEDFFEGSVLKFQLIYNIKKVGNN
jgi:hypothetical protein